jgi:hypothetical protein
VLTVALVHAWPTDTNIVTNSEGVNQNPFCNFGDKSGRIKTQLFAFISHNSHIKYIIMDKIVHSPFWPLFMFICCFILCLFHTCSNTT